MALFVSKTSTSEARTVTFDLPLIAVPGARPVAVFGVAFFPDFLGRRHRKLVANSCAATGHSATQREAQHAAVAASSDKVVSTLGAARTSCSSSRRRSAMRASCCCRLSGASGITAAPSTLGAARTSCSTRRPDSRRQCTFRAWRCVDNPQHSAARCLRLRPLALTIGHQRCTFDPWRCAGELQHSASLRGRQAQTLYLRPLALRG